MVRIEAGLLLQVMILKGIVDPFEAGHRAACPRSLFLAWTPIRRKHPMKLVGLEIDSNVDVDTVIASISAAHRGSNLRYALTASQETLWRALMWLNGRTKTAQRLPGQTLSR
jgi:hypothetical protein